MNTVILTRNACAVVFLIVAALTTAHPAAAERRICMVGLTWQLSGCQTDEACLIESHEMAESGDVGDGCPATCDVGCGAWQDDIWRSNGCAFVNPQIWHSTGQVECYCDPIPGLES